MICICDECFYNMGIFMYHVCGNDGSEIDMTLKECSYFEYDFTKEPMAFVVRLDNELKIIRDD